MNNILPKLLLILTLLCGTVLADDGNMGGGNYTGCGGTNPPQGSSCDQQDPPPGCGGLTVASVDEQQPLVEVQAIVDAVTGVIFTLV